MIHLLTSGLKLVGSVKKMNAKIIFSIVLCQFVSYTVGNGEPNVVSFGDFMEFDIGFHKACIDIPGGENATWTMITAFRDCTYSLSPTPPKDVFENFASICQNQGKYLSCWDQMKAAAVTSCGKDKEQHLPSVYRATLASFCANDKGAKKIGELQQAMAEPQDPQACPNQSHWLETCEPLLDAMNSSDLCGRHTAIETCMKRITCDKNKFANLLRQIYTDARPHLQCNERRA